MKLNASVRALAGAFSLAALAGVTIACSQSSVTEAPIASTRAAPIATASPSPLNASPAAVPTTAVTAQKPITAQKQTAEPTTDPASTASRTVESCVVKMALVDDPKPPLNVRSAPTSDGDNVVGQLKNGTLLTIAADQNGWLQIKTPLKGWVSKQQTVNGCNEKVERLRLNADGTVMPIVDRFIGTGRHRYVVPVNKGQTLTLNRDRGPFPMIIAPNGTILLGHEKDETRSDWSGALDQTGDYTIELESNFRGYRYAFSMQMK